MEEQNELIECHICGSENVDSDNICEKCERHYCDDCSATYNQFSQTDYNCCESCVNRHYED